MNASDYIYEKCPGPRPTEVECADVVEWCNDWAWDVFPAEMRYVSTLQLLRGCESHIVGGLAFVLADVRRCAARQEVQA